MRRSNRTKVTSIIMLLVSATSVVACGITPSGSLVYKRTEVVTDHFDEEDIADITFNNTNIEKTELNPCVIVVNSIEDKRFNESSFGTMDRFEKFSVNIPRWVKTAIFNMKPHRIYEQDINNNHSNTSNDTVVIDVEILKAYVHFYATTKNANLVLRVRYINNATSLTKIYRGDDSSVNWNATAGEVQNAMNIAVNEILDQIATDVSGLC